MNTIVKAKGGLIVGILAVLLLVGFSAAPVQAVVDGIEGNTFDLVARQDYISSPDGDSILMWGYANGGNPMQYPGPTLIVQQGETITINLTNELPAAHGQNVSIVFPGQVVTASGGVAGALTNEVEPGGAAVTYTFEATHPGTFMYKSGTRPDLQVEMGLVGAIVVRSAMPSVVDPRPYTEQIHYAYNHADTAYNREYLYLVTEIDVKIHDMVESGNLASVDTTTWYPVTWMVNGRAFPDLLQSPNVPWFPTQPYNCVPRIHPFETMLIRVVGAGRAQHPMHYHGQDFSVIGINGRMLSSNGGAAGPDLAWKASTFNFTPGQTADMLWRWEGSGLGWDVYGHAPGDSVLEGYEDAAGADHGQPFPVILAERDDLAFGQFWSGSPFLGASGDLPPSHPGLNSGGAYLFPWHSHSEKELTTNDIFPGGALTFVVVEHPFTVIDPQLAVPMN
jgi:FtsP/CotA-like multicopper oxidase with cupredoxin domain